ncbi:cyclopropane-fatty-acyl-phospholipid synthase family protein [Sphingomonas sp. MG17]|uniref:Cyclopropane-fatty-acyl-phospholipid synthase family protein n=1 Tax=Sphingomonas tagetis TaxID=2949092 RepID=A0A9X2HM05_9SPHN|nr:cyclopropane-fatty-acyl-phospholipid synthase family protein [Sphingomonas tagetis]MCP3730204.1 cyclopropane-fatty-acyl-phospholipid synthase family protein [Sphingomonas tagetis]
MNSRVASNRGRRNGRGNGARAPGQGWLAALLTPLLHKLLDRIDAGLAEGAIEATLPGGIARRLGGRVPGPVAVVEIRSWRALWRLATGGSVGWYEAWQAGEWASPDPVPLFDLFVRNRATLGNTGRAQGTTRLAKRVWHRLQRNDRDGARKNIAYHYDLGNDFYAPWLDPGMTYSSALFAEARMTLQAAQHAKLAAVLARTGTVAGERILEIGCGWGSFVELAARGGRRVHGITLSTEQKAQVEARIAAAGLDGVTVGLTDYRDVTGTFDAVASIEMVEAVGQDFWPDYLGTIARVLKPGGRAAIQYIAIDDAIFDAYSRNVDFIQTYVFPGGLLISERRFRKIAAQHGLSWHDRHAFGLDYAETLRRWREAFDAAVAEGRLPAEFDAHFLDLWRYYLMYCEGGFRGGGIWVAQVTLVKS